MSGKASATGHCPRKVCEIPAGLLHLDARGRILDHEDARRRPLVGRNLFTDVPPFAGAEGLRACFEGFLASGRAGCEITLTLQAEQGATQVKIFFGRICADIALARIRVKAAGE